MVHNSHKKWREAFGTGTLAGQQDFHEGYGISKDQFRNLRRSHPIIPYTLEVEANSYWGNFEREFLGYCMGILDDVQMHIEFADEERLMFWKEVFNKDDAPDFDEALESYELLQDYLYETFQDCDDWWQLTFYSIDWDTTDSDILKIQLVKPLSKKWEDIIIPRMQKFFTDKIYKYMNPDTKLLSVRLFDKNHDLVKEYDIKLVKEIQDSACDPSTAMPVFTYAAQCREYLNRMKEDYAPLNTAVLFFKSPVSGMIEVRHVLSAIYGECDLWARARIEEYQRLNFPFAIYTNGGLLKSNGQLFD